LDRSAVALFVAGETGLDGWQVTGVGELIEDAAPDHIVLRAAARMRDTVADEAIQYLECARGGKFCGGGTGGLGRGRAQAFERKKKDSCKNE
jgi:hypothetical protein